MAKHQQKREHTKKGILRSIILLIVLMTYIVFATDSLHYLQYGNFPFADGNTTTYLDTVEISNTESATLLSSLPVFEDSTEYSLPPESDEREVAMLDGLLSVYSNALETKTMLPYSYDDLVLIAQFAKIFVDEPSFTSAKQKIGVGKVVLNRILRSDYPNSAREVLADKSLNPYPLETLSTTKLTELDILIAKLVYCEVPNVSEWSKNTVFVKKWGFTDPVPEDTRLICEFKDLMFYEKDLPPTPPPPVKSKPAPKPSVSKPSGGSTVRKTVIKYTQQELNDFAKLISCEYGNGSFNAKLAVATVVVNRVKSQYFPNTLRGVIYAPRQFSSVTDKMWTTRKPTSEDFEVVKLALAGEICKSDTGKVLNDVALYFCNPKNVSKSTLKWFNSLPKYGNAGAHAFYGR